MIAVFAAAAILFAPPLDRTIRYRLVEERTAGEATVRFQVERSVSFARRGDGYEATVTTLAVDGTAPAEPERVFERGLGALLGKPLRFTLDASGRITGATVGPAVWSGFVDALAAAMHRPGALPARAAAVAGLLAPLRSAPPAQQSRLLAASLTPLLPSGDTPVAAYPVRPVTAQARTSTGETVTLTGQERVEQRADGRLRLIRSLSGSAPGTPPVAMIRSHEVVVDPATGMVGGTRSETSLRIGNRTELVVRQLMVL